MSIEIYRKIPTDPWIDWRASSTFFRCVAKRKRWKTFGKAFQVRKEGWKESTVGKATIPTIEPAVRRLQIVNVMYEGPIRVHVQVSQNKQNIAEFTWMVKSISEVAPCVESSCSQCFLKFSFKSFETPMSWNILCNLDVYSNPQA